MNAQLYADLVAADKKPLPPSVIKGLVQAVDSLLIILAAVVSTWLVPTPGDEPFNYFYIVSLAVILSLLVFRIYGAYSDGVVFSKVPRIRAVTFGWFAVTCVMLFIDFALDRSTAVGRLWAYVWVGSTLTFLIIGRVGVSLAINRLSHTGHISRRSVIVGTGPIGQSLAANLNRMGEAQTKLLGFIDVRASDAEERAGNFVPSDIEGYHVLGGMPELLMLIREERVEQVFVALPTSSDKLLGDVLEILRMMPVDVRLVPAIARAEFGNRPMSSVAGLPIIHVSDKPISGWDYAIKAVEDRVIAGLVLLFALPVFCLIAVAIKLDSPGPVLFKQPRRGFNNRLFEVYKFRSMYHNMADLDCDVQTTRHDPRITGIGRLLRRTSLDELPQLINVLKGDMSIVGPRPHAVSTKAEGRLFEEVVSEYPSRYRVKPGITGWAQVNGWRGETDTELKLRKRIEYDLFYIENWSVLFDLWIMVRTVFVVFNDEKAY